LAFRDITPIKEARESLEEAYRYERHIAQLLQRALLPTEPFIGQGYEVVAKYVSAYAGEDVGGDFYDVFKTADGHVGLLIGDIAGKGIEAASLAAATRSTVRAFAYESSSAGGALTHANLVLYGQQPQIGSFVTVFLAILDPISGDIVYSNAGHPPPLISHIDGNIELLRYGQPPIGILEQQEFNESASHISPGERMLIYTDGLIEARRGLEMFGIEGVERVMKEHGRRNVNEILVELLNIANDWTKGRQTDDMAIMVIGRE
jgi:serine phosphatase RsbU (regulator of sigma subunit)